MPRVDGAGRFGWQAAFLACLAAVTWLLLMPQEVRPPGLPWDKPAHALAFGALALLAHRAWPDATLSRIAVALMGYGLLTELLQIGIPGRSFSVLDLAADAAGIAAYAAASAVATRRAPRHDAG